MNFYALLFMIFGLGLVAWLSARARATRMSRALPARRLTLALAFGPEPDARTARLTASGPGWDWLAEVLP